jgi:ribosomal protein S18 acetylase RimI-like enzyme
VQPAFRGMKIGEKLLQSIAEEAIAIHCPRICFQALEWNTPALNFYSKYQAEQDAEWINLVVYPENVLGQL